MAPFQKKFVDGKFRSFLLSKVKEERIEKLEKVEKERIEKMGEEIEVRKKYFRGTKICKSVQNMADIVKDPNSMFKDSEFIEKMTGCKIKSRKPKYQIKN